MNRPRTGEIYRHFKGNLYQIVGIANHSETGEELVIYQALYGDFRMYARPLEMFMSPVDEKKYPEAAQKSRFQRIDRGTLAEETKGAAMTSGPAVRENGDTENLTKAQQLVMSFLDLSSAADRMALLEAKEEELTSDILETMAAALDVEVHGDSLEEQKYDLIRVLRTQARFETGRMR